MLQTITLTPYFQIIISDVPLKCEALNNIYKKIEENNFHLHITKIEENKFHLHITKLRN